MTDYKKIIMITGRGRRGSILLYVVVAITILSAVAAGMMSMTTSSTYSELLADNQARAMYLAEAGFNYAAMFIEKDGAVDPVAALNGQKFTLAAGESFELAVTAEDTYKYGITSTGIADEGSTFEARYAMSQYIVDLTDTSTPPPDPVTIDFTDLGEWIVDPSLVDIDEGISSLNVHNEYSVTQMRLTRDPTDRNVWTYTMLLDKAVLMKQAWAANNTYLHYDVQAKAGWGYQLDYGAQGITFRYHESSPGSGLHECYGLSFMMYRGSGSDHMPASIKPRYKSLANTPLIVLWKQWVDDDGDTQRVWMAYKDLSDETFIRGGQWRYDGQCFTDNSALMVRIRERKVDDQRYNDIQVFVSDSSIKYGPLDGALCDYGSWSDCSYVTYYPGPIYRTPDQVAYDVLMFREVYYPEYAAEQADPHNRLTNGSPFPIWAPGDDTSESAFYNGYSGVWQTLTNDYFTQVAKTFDWDEVNTGDSNNAGLSVLSDGGTIRDPSFTSPLTDEDFPVDDDTGAEDRYEVGLHFFGPLDQHGYSENENMYFDDFAIQWLSWTAP